MSLIGELSDSSPRKRRFVDYNKRLDRMAAQERRASKKALPPVPSEIPPGCVGVQPWGKLPAKPPGRYRENGL